MLGYNERNELTSSERDDEADLIRTYTSDPPLDTAVPQQGQVGNRTTYTMAGAD